MTKNVLIIPDTHYPLVDKRVWSGILKLVDETQPDEIIHIGDLMDYPQPSRWTKGTKEEFEETVYRDSNKAIEDIINPLREVYDGPIGVHEGNHDLRPRAYMQRYAPALANTRYFDFDILLEFEAFEITKLPDFYQVAPGWVTTHGHLGGIRLNQNAGATALNGAKKAGTSIIMGHTHRAGLMHWTTGLQGKTSTLTGMEVGHIMDTKKVTYLNGATGNWQQALGWLTIDKGHVTPFVLPVVNNKIHAPKEVIEVR